MSKSKQWCNSHRVSADDAQCFNGFYEFVSYIIHSNIQKTRVVLFHFTGIPGNLHVTTRYKLGSKRGRVRVGSVPLTNQRTRPILRPTKWHPIR